MLELLKIFAPLFGLMLSPLLIPAAVEIAGHTRDSRQRKQP